MRNILFSSLWVLIVAGTLYGQIGLKKSYTLSPAEINVGQSFLGNGIVDILVQDSLLWAATGFGINKSSDGGFTWQSFGPADYLSKGGVAAMKYMDDSTLWISTAFETREKDEDLVTGGGLSYTRDGGATWTHIEQPVDSRDETEYSPTTTAILNVTYDIAFIDSTVWIATFGGGLRRSDDMGQNWQVVTTDNLPFSSLEYLNHRGFSLLSENGNLWFGSADGISKSSDNGKTWQRFTHLNQKHPISGNFVVALGYQQATGTVWAATIEALGKTERRAVSKTTNGGQTWTVVLEDIFAHGFGFDGDRVFVAADEGVFISDDGENWYRVPHIEDSQTGEEILTGEYFSAAVQVTPQHRVWWLGSGDGLISSFDQGNTWRIVRSFVSTQTRKKPKVYAYPSPFSPSRGRYTRFQYHVSGDTDVTIKIYNFAMEHVVTIKEQESAVSTEDRTTKWDGRDTNGDLVASGVYFFKARVGKTTSWGKVVVIN